jgi:hypothetical protein
MKITRRFSLDSEKSNEKKTVCCSIKSFGSAPCLLDNVQKQKEAFLKFQSINSQLFAMLFDWLKIKKY